MPALNRFQLSMFLKQFRILLDSGKSEAEALETISVLAGSDRIRTAASKAVDGLQAGRPLAEALFPPGHPFPGGMARCLAGLRPGDQDLARTLESLEENYAVPARIDSGTVDIRRLIFFTIIFLLVVFIVLGGVVPLFESMYADFGSALPALTQLAFDLSNFVIGWWFVVIICLAVLFFLFHRFMLRPAAISVKTHQVFSLMNKRIEAGGEVVQALAWAADSVDDAELRIELDRVHGRVKNGRGLAESFSNTGYFPPLVSDVLAMGEERDSLKSALRELADHFGGRNRSDWAGTGRLFEIGLIVFLIVLVGMLVLAMYLPIFGMASAVG